MRILSVSVFLLAFLGASAHAEAADASGTNGSLSREEMAAKHEKVAACLRSDRATQECMDEMKTAMHGGGCCPMMGECPASVSQGSAANPIQPLAPAERGKAATRRYKKPGHTGGDHDHTSEKAGN